MHTKKRVDQNLRRSIERDAKVNGRGAGSPVKLETDAEEKEAS